VVGSYGALTVDGVVLSQMKNGIPSEFLGVFRDDMLVTYNMLLRDYDSRLNLDADDEETIDIVAFRASGREIATRLDVLGIGPDVVKTIIESFLHDVSGIGRDPEWLQSVEPDLRTRIEEENRYRDTLDAEHWIELLAASHPAGEPDSGRIGIGPADPGSRAWLLDLIDGWDPRYALRAFLLAFPDALVELDVTELHENDWLGFDPETLASETLTALRLEAAAHAPMVVLTEGSTDAEFLSAALMLRYPYLVDLVRFLDYGERPEGGVAALLRLVRSFAAAGIANRVVALFDNDAAAQDGLRGLRAADLPANIALLRYPDLDLLREYPTLGPPTLDAPSGAPSEADINGLGASIELYLGVDCLSDADGRLRPVQWRAFMHGVSRYQGEVVGKREIQDAFRAKIRAARADPNLMNIQDWSGMDAILHTLLTIFGDHPVDLGE
jgi:hypothetical protein